MRFQLPAYAVALSLALPACASLTSAPSVQLGIAEGSLAIDTAYNVAAQAYLAAAPSLPPTTKATIKADLLKVYACTGTGATLSCTGYLQAAHDAQKAGDATTLAAQIALAAGVLAEVKSLLPATGA